MDSSDHAQLLQLIRNFDLLMDLVPLESYLSTTKKDNQQNKTVKPSKNHRYIHHMMLPTSKRIKNFH